ncbi:MAG: bifunctional (p)ppGpp synthetase/guanosine-3',5'-bis(diphosphate) 3'-pyrophosphohydrolase [Proteobacteria bacterium]|nr:bifunctional (p)ppGpp synthetase/guanosine-3',5'-bis(diphosphate) 3'-pyrophosphohydrolase [Pseudomonadota bacterium]
MLRFNDIADRVFEYNPQANLELLQAAYIYSAKVHDGQERLSGEPYLVHPLEVAGILVDMRLDEETVVAGLLHDTVEDTLTTLDEIERLFGEKVAFLVGGLTKIAKIEFTSDRERQAENFRKMLVAMSRDIRILLIKLADRLHNMRTLGFMGEDARRRVAQETLEIYVPLAHRLGIFWMKSELQDLAFRAAKPEVAEDLERQLRVGRDKRDEYMQEVKATLSETLVEAGVDAEVTGRQKDLASIHAKMENQGVGLDQIYDVIAFRIVLEGDQEACYKALGAVHGTWPPVPGRFKDYVALPKPNGYQSLHTTVIGPYGERMEIQIRTREMHYNAEMGISAHWKYKGGDVGVGSEDERRFAWLRQLLEWQQEVDDPHEFLDTVKVDLFPDEVFVFTPRGEVINLPKLATPVDFAYAIHSEVGDRCAGARVNGKMVPLRHHLRDGDTVEIVTNPQQFPRKDWLEFVVSGKARNRVRHAIRRAQNERSRQLGRDILERELRRAGLSLARLLEGDSLAKLAQRELKRGSTEELFAAVGYGRIAATDLVAKLKGDAEEPEPASRSLRSLFRRPRRAPSTSGIRVSGNPDVLVRFGGCCAPIPGDDVVGFVTRGRGVTVHRKDCARVFELDPDRRMPVEWDDGSNVSRKIKIRVRSKDQPGILAQITKSISAAGVNIGSAQITTDRDGQAIQSFELWVGKLETLRDVMRQIEKVKGVLSVERVRS